MSAITDLFRKGSGAVRRKIIELRDNRVKVERPSWDAYFMNIAHAVSLRSPDSQTKVGCVIVNDKRQILGCGYNGPVAGIDDNYLSNLRPTKYFSTIHGEVNGISNCPQKPVDGIVYVNMRPCCTCLQIMAQTGIKEVVYIDRKPAMCQEEDEDVNFQIMTALLENKLKLRLFSDS